jgi:putative redox protein
MTSTNSNQHALPDSPALGTTSETPSPNTIVKGQLKLDTAMRFVGTNAKQHKTYFDTSVKGGGLDSAASPMEVVLQSVAACTAMDVLPILRKQRRTVVDFSIDLEAERATKDPKVFTKIHMEVRLTTPDAKLRELARAMQLSQTTYCSVSTMITRGGCEITWRATLVNTDTGMEESISSSDIQVQLN